MTSSMFNKIRKHLLQYHEKQHIWASSVQFDSIGNKILNEKELRGKKAAMSRAYNNAHRLKEKSNMDSGLWLQLIKDTLQEWKNEKK